MSGYSGFVDNTTGLLIAHENMLDAFEAKLQLKGWTTLRKLNTGGTGDARKYELIMQGVGLSGTEQIFIGFQCYQSSTSDYYNISYSVFTGYIAGNTFDTQPGVNVVSVCAHNQRIDYWMSVDAQSIVFCLKVGTPVYEWGGMGKFFPDCQPQQWPYPVFVSGTLNGRPATRYSDTTHQHGFYGNTNRMFMRKVDGTWYQAGTTALSTNNQTILRDTNGKYHLIPIELCDQGGRGTGIPSTNVYGWIGNVYFLTGFNNLTENTLTYSGKNYTILQDVQRNSFNNYLALDMTP